MDGQEPGGVQKSDGIPAVVTAHCAGDDPRLTDRIIAQLAPGDPALVILFVSPEVPFGPVLSAISAHFANARVMACTTAGEIAQGLGYTEGSVVAMALSRQDFDVEVVAIPDLDVLSDQDMAGHVIRARADLRHRSEGKPNEFAFLMVDGLTMHEDQLASSLAAGLGSVPLFGGSAGDGTRFETVRVGLDGEARENAAVLALVRTACRVRVFSLNHFNPTGTRMVVTRADPSHRIVQEINGEAAAAELGRLLGKDPAQIDTFTFAENPMAVRLGGRHHVRAIKRVTPNGDLEFFSAIDEGLVLTLTEAEPVVDHLEQQLQALSRHERPEAILACECILRRIEAQQKQCQRALSEVMQRHQVAGFSTYGEQINGMHVNQTMTGVAIYAPGDEDDA